VCHLTGNLFGKVYLAKVYWQSLFGKGYLAKVNWQSLFDKVYLVQGLYVMKPSSFTVAFMKLVEL